MGISLFRGLYICAHVLTRDRSLGGGIACVYACFYFCQKQLCGSSRFLADRHIRRFCCVRYYFGCIRACAVCLIWIGMWVRARNSMPNKTIFLGSIGSNLQVRVVVLPITDYDSVVFVNFKKMDEAFYSNYCFRST